MTIDVRPTAIADVKLLTPAKVHDQRGFLSEVFCHDDLAAAGIAFDVMQENHLMSVRLGTIRGLHFQTPPCAQAKLVRAVRGRVFDVAVDLRRSSPSFGRHVAVELSAENWHQLFIPEGFAHGLCSLEADTEVVYKASACYSRECARGLLWNDPDLGIEWPIDATAARLSEADRAHPRLRELPVFFN